MSNNSSAKDKSYLSGNSFSRRKVIHINFICSGNTCRSYIAEAIASYLLKNIYSKKHPALKNKVIVGSAGTDVSEKTIPLNSTRALDIIEIPNIKFRPKPADKKIVKNSDLLITMATTHGKNLMEGHPDADRLRIFNLMELSNLVLYIQSEEIFSRNGAVRSPYRSAEDNNEGVPVNDALAIAASTSGSSRQVNVETVREKLKILKQMRQVAIAGPPLAEISDPSGRSIDFYAEVAKLIEENIITVFNYLFE
jgi:protein-tyrosine-phosphatase